MCVLRQAQPERAISHAMMLKKSWGIVALRALMLLVLSDMAFLKIVGLSDLRAHSARYAPPALSAVRVVCYICCSNEWERNA